MWWYQCFCCAACMLVGLFNTALLAPCDYTLAKLTQQVRDC